MHQFQTLSARKDHEYSCEVAEMCDTGGDGFWIFLTDYSNSNNEILNASRIFTPDYEDALHLFAILVNKNDMEMR